MTTAYWSQWSHVELMSMQGIEIEDEDYEDEEEVEIEEFVSRHKCPYCSSGCSYCLL